MGFLAERLVAKGSRQRGGLAMGSPRAGRRWHRGGAGCEEESRDKGDVTGTPTPN